MNYTIFDFQQEKLLIHNLTLDHALVMKTIKDLYFSDAFDSIIFEEQKYIWIKQEYLLSQIPILGSLSKLKRVLKQLTDQGYLKSHMVTNRKGMAGRYYYVTYTKKMFDLSTYDASKVQNELWSSVKMNFNQSSKWPNKDTNNNNTNNNNTNIVKPSKFDKESFEMRVVEYLYLSCLNLNPNFKEPNKDKWAIEVDRMKRLDKRSEVDILKVLAFATKDPFWQTNILSTAKLRKQFDQLYMKCQKHNTKEVVDF